MIFCQQTHRYYSTIGGWWPCEVTALLSMHRDGYNPYQMALVLDRSYYAVFSKLNRLVAK